MTESIPNNITYKYSDVQYTDSDELKLLIVHK